MAFFDATDAFDEALFEIDQLLFQRSGGHRDTDEATRLKAAIVLLAAKLEAFAENIVDDYVDALSSRRPKAKHLPTSVKEKSTAFLLSMARGQDGSFCAKKEAIRNLSLAAMLWDDDAAIEELKINSKFNYGKHGSAELGKLFIRVGISDIFERCKVFADEVDTFIVPSGKKSVTADVDSLINIRNNIVHGDTNPASVTIRQVEGYRRRIWEFCYLVDLELQRELDSIDTRMAVPE